MITKKASLKENQIYLKFPFSYEMVAKIKKIEGSIWSPKSKEWIIPFLNKNVTLLTSLDFVLNDNLKDKISPLEPVSNLQIKPINVKMKKELFPFQKIGVGFLEYKNGSALLGDEMGLGKTIQALAWLSLHPEKLPVIIVCPATIKSNWYNEIQDWVINPPSVQILQGKNPYTITGDILIINYDILPTWIGTLISLKPQIVITDEAHYYKNNAAKRTKAAKALIKISPHFIPISGTPIINRPIEFFNMLNLLAPSLFPNRWKFGHKYCAAKHTGFGWDLSGASHTKELYESINNVLMIRRLKKDVLKDLPGKLYSHISLPLNNRTEYRTAENDFKQYIRDDVENKARNAFNKMKDSEYGELMQFDENKLKQLQDDKENRINILTQIEILKQLAVQGILPQAISWIEDFLETGEKLIVFATHKFVIDSLMETFSNISVKIDGSVPTNKRQQTVDKFQKDKKIKLFIGNIKAAGIGITLTSASSVAFLELPWTPGELVQAIDRTHRIGQKKLVNVYFLIAANTVLQKIAKLLDKKRKVLNSVLDGGISDNKSLFAELIENI